MFVDSDPPGAHILVDQKDTGHLTPDTVRRIGGQRQISVQIDTFQALYGFTARVFVPDNDSVLTLSGPLVNRCGDGLCYANQFRHYAANRVRFADNPVGTFFLERAAPGGGNGILWPDITNNSYATGSMVGFAGILGGRDTVALGIYDNVYLAGRPTPVVVQTADRLDITHDTWIVPPPGALGRPTVRGIQISEHAVASKAVEDVVLLHLTFTNITNNPLYRSLDNTIPAGGLSYDQAYIGFLLDPDIGISSDDMLSYDPDLNMAFAYDFRFEENDFQAGYNRGPGLVGLRMVEAPAGTRIILNGWTTTAPDFDWVAGQISEPTGWLMLSGTKSFDKDHPDPRIGHLPGASGDVRISVTAGPLHLAPGDSATVTVAIVLADPQAGTFTSGTPLDPGDPTDRTRVLYGVARNLLARAAAAGNVASSVFAASPVMRR